MNVEWIVDLKSMTCRNSKNQILVKFEKRGKSITGVIDDMPLSLLQELANKPDGEEYIKEAVLKAEEVFMRTFFKERNSK